MFFQASLLFTLTAAAFATHYKAFNGFQCVRPEFVQTHGDVQSKLECTSLCEVTPNCQAFSVADGPCLLFVFHRCSKLVRDCNCTRRVSVFVKQQPGLPPGAMCPVGFTDDLCGSKYKFYDGIKDWNVAKTTVDAEPGLTIMADVSDDAEMTHLKSILIKYSLNIVILGGFQAPGSAEPAGGWSWVSCNTDISSSLWTDNEPNNDGGNETITVVAPRFTKLNDASLRHFEFSGVLVECVSPFG